MEDKLCRGVFHLCMEKCVTMQNSLVDFEKVFFLFLFKRAILCSIFCKALLFLVILFYEFLDFKKSIWYNIE